MKTVNLIIGILIFTLFGCTSDNYSDINNESSLAKRDIEVRFSLPVSSHISDMTKQSGSIQINNNKKSAIELKPFQYEATKNTSYSPIPIGSTIRVCAYKRKTSTANTAVDEFITSQAYELMENGILTPITVDANGVKTGSFDQEMFLSNETVDLYAYSPAIPLNTNYTVLINQNSNFITSSVLGTTISSDNKEISFPTFSRQMARVKFIIQPDSTASSIDSISIEGVGFSMSFLTESPYTHIVGNAFTPNTNSSVYVFPKDSCTQINETTIICQSLVLPLKKSEPLIQLNLNINGVPTFFYASLPEIEYQAGNEYIYSVRIKTSKLNVQPVSNCYMVVPNDPIYFPVNQISVMGTFNLSTQNWKAEVIWETTEGMVEILDQDQSGDFLEIETNTTGNALIAVTPVNSNSILWSWHIWSTNYVPGFGMNSTKSATSVPGGYVYRLPSSAFTGNKKVIMDRNLGAMGTTHNISSWGMLYQWGRKDPFPPAGINVEGEDIDYDLAYLANYNTSIQNPTTFYYGYFNWLLGGSDYLWENSSKTIFDPCPVGWKVAPSSAYNVPMSTTIKWTSGPTVYTDGATYTPLNIWYPAQGGIYNLTGNPTGRGNTVYLWSCTDGFFDSSYALYITKQMNTSANDLDRAYGFPVRCIQE